VFTPFFLSPFFLFLSSFLRWSSVVLPFSALSLSETVPHSFSFRHFRPQISSWLDSAESLRNAAFYLFSLFWFYFCCSPPAFTIFVFALIKKIFFRCLYSLWLAGEKVGSVSMTFMQSIIIYLWSLPPETYTRAKVYIQMHGIYFQAYL